MKNILIVSPIPTHPDFAGNRKCTISYSQILSELGFNVKYLWVSNSKTSEEEYIQTQNYWGNRLIQFRKSIFDRIYESLHRRLFFKITNNLLLDTYFPFRFNKFLSKVQKKEKFDIIIVNYAFLSKSFFCFKNQKKILFTHDSFTECYKKTGLEWFSISAKGEAKALNRADVILSIQEDESTYFRTLTNKPVITCFTFFPQFETPFSGNQTILYLAGPNNNNIKGIERFINESFILLKNILPQIKIVIGGKICDKIIHLAHIEGVILLGNIDDLYKYYSIGDVVINPVFSGTGLKIKSFEALAYGKVLISHPHNTIGIFNRTESPILEAEKADEFVSHLVRIFNHKDEIIRLKKQSVKYMSDFNNHVTMKFKEAVEI